jgi:hypothetical protein
MEKKVTKKKTTKKSAIEKLSKNITKKPTKETKNEIESEEDIILEEYKRIAIEKENISKYTGEQLGEWIIDKFYAMVEVINYTVQHDFLNAENTQARFYKLYFVTELWKLLEQYEIDITIDTRDYLTKKQEAEILDTLSFLNFV